MGSARGPLRSGWLEAELGEQAGRVPAARADVPGGQAPALRGSGPAPHLGPKAQPFRREGTQALSMRRGVTCCAPGETVRPQPRSWGCP